MTDRLRDQRLELSRRHLIRAFGAGAAGAFALRFDAYAIAQPIFRTDPFQLGIASGDPAPDGFVLWTRLAPDPLEPGGGMPMRGVEVGWEVAEDAGFRKPVQKGVAIARPELAHAVHVEVTGLAPGRPYHYRFTAGRERSGVGRALTMPAAGAPLDRLRFAVAGCQHYEQGWFTAHRHLAAERPDFVFCYGDYIYEGRGNRLRNGPDGPMEAVRQHAGDEIYSIDDYRRRYAQYKSDPDLQAAHAAAPWWVVWDDHEIDNNWVTDADQDGTPATVFALRRQMAMQAYYEHMPLRAASMPVGAAMRIYRHARYGDLLDLNLLDTRQYRTDQPCGDRWGDRSGKGSATGCAEASRRDAGVLGRAQEDWLLANLSRPGARWRALAQQVMMMDLDRDPGPELSENLDSWAGYRVPRARLLSAIRERGIRDVVVLTGDEHQNYAGELQVNGRQPERDPVAVEFVATSITSGGDGEDQRAQTAAFQTVNPQLKFHNGLRGYLLCDLTPERWLTDYKVLNRVSVPDAPIRSRIKLAVEPGRSRLTEA